MIATKHTTKLKRPFTGKVKAPGVWGPYETYSVYAYSIAQAELLLRLRFNKLHHRMSNSYVEIKDLVEEQK